MNRITREEDIELWQLIAELRHTMVRVRKRELAPFDITPRQSLVLLTMRSKGNTTTLDDLSNHIDRAVSSLSAQITRMGNKGLIIKRQEKPGSPLKRIKLTKKGLKTCDICSKRESIHKTMSILSKEECDQLRSTITKLLKKANELI